MTENKLKPCPFCGGEAQIQGGHFRGAWIMCLDCFVETPFFKSVIAAIAAWNRRSSCPKK
jgi:Lar family restriction alleviation protein